MLPTSSSHLFAWLFAILCCLFFQLFETHKHNLKVYLNTIFLLNKFKKNKPKVHYVQTTHAVAPHIIIWIFFQHYSASFANKACNFTINFIYATQISQFFINKNITPNNSNNKQNFRIHHLIIFMHHIHYNCNKNIYPSMGFTFIQVTAFKKDFRVIPNLLQLLSHQNTKKPNHPLDERRKS